MNWASVAALAGRRVHVVGLASTEGAALTRFLWAEGVRNLTVHDFLAGTELEKRFHQLHLGLPAAERAGLWAQLEELPFVRRTGQDYLAGIETAEVVFAGQGWYLYPANVPALADLRDRGVPFHSLTELYFGLAPCPITAVTGSNGKSTTSTLIVAMLKAAGQAPYFAGNERRSIQCVDRLRQMTADDRLVLEVSNRQLMDFQGRASVAVLTNVLANHLEEHGGSMAAYAAVKRRLFEAQTPADAGVFNADCPVSVALARGLSGRPYWFSLTGEVANGAFVRRGTIELCEGGSRVEAGPVDLAALPGAHNRANLLAAALGAWLSGAPPDAIAQAAAEARPLPHRLQPVGRVDGVAYYDDLNATSPQATQAALAALERPVVLIAGGDDKGLDFGPLADRAASTVRAAILLPGAGSERLAASLAAADPPVAMAWARSLREAVDIARATATAGDAVLLSPACPGFFSRYYVDASGPAGFRRLVGEMVRTGNAPAQGGTDDE